jgi:hypothetical protein
MGIKKRKLTAVDKGLQLGMDATMQSVAFKQLAVFSWQFAMLIIHSKPLSFYNCLLQTAYCKLYSTVTDFAKLRGWSTLQPRITAMW